MNHTKAKGGENIVSKLNNSDRITALEQSPKPNVFVAAGTVWNYEQLNEVIDNYSRYGELVKLELTIDRTPSKNAYHYIVWHYELLNRTSPTNSDKDE